METNRKKGLRWRQIENEEEHRDRQIIRTKLETHRKWGPIWQ